jgi:hypothetical protein
MFAASISQSIVITPEVFNNLILSDFSGFTPIWWARFTCFDHSPFVLGGITILWMPTLLRASGGYFGLHADDRGQS